MPDTVLFHGLLADPAQYNLPVEYDTFHLPCHGKRRDESSIDDLLHAAERLPDYDQVIAHSAGAIFAARYLCSHDVANTVFIEPGGLPFYDNENHLFKHWVSRGLLGDEHKIQVIRQHPMCSLSMASFATKTLFNLLINGKVGFLRSGIQYDASKDLASIRNDVHLIWCTNGLFDDDYQSLYEQTVQNTTTRVVPQTHAFPVCTDGGDAHDHLNSVIRTDTV